MQNECEVYQNTKSVEQVGVADMPTRYGHFRCFAYQARGCQDAHLALVKGSLTADAAVLVRIHSECLTGDVLGSLRCDCGDQLAAALKAIEKEGTGVLLYIRQEGRGIGLLNKIRAYELQDQGMDTVDANEFLGFPSDMRDYRLEAEILKDLGIQKVRLLTNNPRKINGLRKNGLEIVERVPLEIPPGLFNWRYLATKKKRMGHVLNLL